MNIWIYGPRGCGKTTNAEALKKFFVMDRIYDEGDDPFSNGKTMNLHGNLILSTEPADNIPGFLAVYKYNEAMAIMGGSEL